MPLRDHEPFIIEEFNGLWDRGDDESCPADHFIVADNVQYFESGVETRNPLARWQDGVSNTPLLNIQRVYNYVMQNGQSLLVMATGGSIWHLVGPNVAYELGIFPGANDFAFVAIAGRAYISPFVWLKDASGQNYEMGVKGEFLYVYKGDGTPWRPAGGSPPTNGGVKPFIAYNDSRDGSVTKGIHLFIVTYDDNTYGPPIFPIIEAPGNQKVQLNNIPVGPSGVGVRAIVMTHAIDPKDYIPGQGHTYYAAVSIPDNTTTDLLIDVPDSALTVVYNFGSPETISANGALMATHIDVAGFCDIGFHIFAVVYETDTGYLTAPGPEVYGSQTYVDVKKKIRIINIPVSPDAYVKKRHIISTKTIPEYNGDQKGYQFFFVPKGTLEDNTTTFIDLSYYDSDLVSDASHLLDNYSRIPAGVALNTYHGRLVLVGDPTYPEKTDGTEDTTKPDNRSVARVSAPGEPEAISKVDGLIIAPLDGNPLTNCQEFRDILYLFKKTRTYAYVDNGDAPSTWQEEILDQGIGAPVHGIATVLDSGGVNIDYLLIVDWSGLVLFNGTYSRPELSWKIEDYWQAQIKSRFRHIQIANDSIGKKIYISLPPPYQNFMLHADYGNGLDPKAIRWSRWYFEPQVTSLCLIETDKLILGMDTFSPEATY